MHIMNFRHYIRKCNPDIFVDTNHRAYPFGDVEHPTSGMYVTNKEDTKFLMGVSADDVPEYTLASIDVSELKEHELKNLEDTGIDLANERIIWRGWRAIMNNLIRQGYIEKKKAEKVFNTYFEPQRIQLPRQYINKEI